MLRTAVADDIGDRDAAHFEALVADADAQRGSDEKAALDRLEVEHDNLRAALAWSLDSDLDTGVRLVTREHMNDPDAKELLQPDLAKWLKN